MVQILKMSFESLSFGASGREAGGGVGLVAGATVEEESLIARGGSGRKMGGGGGVDTVGG